MSGFKPIRENYKQHKNNIYQIEPRDGFGQIKWVNSENIRVCPKSRNVHIPLKHQVHTLNKREQQKPKDSPDKSSSSSEEMVVIDEIPKQDEDTESELDADENSTDHTEEVHLDSAESESEAKESSSISSEPEIESLFVRLPQNQSLRQRNHPQSLQSQKLKVRSPHQ